MNVRTARPSILAAIALAAAATPAPAADVAPRKLTGLSKEQIKALPDNEKVEINGKVLTRAQLKVELEKGRARVKADLLSQVRGKLTAFDQMKARNATVQNEKARGLKASALAEAGRIAAAMPSPGAAKPTPAPPQDPKLTSVGAAYVMPGGSFMVAGQALGSQQGTARLEGQFPGGGLSLTVEIWKNNLAVLTVPAGVSGVVRQTARVALKRADNRATNTLPVPFEPVTDMKVLGSHDVIVVCSNGSDIDNCDPLADSTFEGTHANTFDISNDSGQDKFKVNLKNGWVVDSWDFVKGGYTFNAFANGYNASLHGISAGASTFDILVNFSVQPATNLEYYGLVYVRGPVGTSYK